ncbi:hypothetical protein [Rhodococcus sp. B10]|uniref:hypothetical protein n=1 Tax=Rhodococcus sp. B10 TaxID=2695876 RepID=UPI00142FF600|nr:hypothetical protein [Rhodococcus sp. B10]NIL75197.1 hypothetical protein [Rhodococcus sp. B10]
MSVRLAGALIKRVMVGSTAAKRIMVGTGATAVQVWTAFTSMGMSKSGTQVTTTNSTSSSANTITGWVPQAAYPGTVIDADTSLVMSESGEVTITATATISSSGTASHSRGIHLRIDGANVATDSTTVGSQTSFATSYTGPVTAGQKIGMAAWVQATTSGYRNLTAAEIVVKPTV